MLKTYIWILSPDEKTLSNYTLSMKLTKIEIRVLIIFVRRPRRAISHCMIIQCMGKNPDTYKGISMCVSRLNRKFKKITDGDRLLICVRNRGFYLTQKILLSEAAPI